MILPVTSPLPQLAAPAIRAHKWWQLAAYVVLGLGLLLRLLVWVQQRSIVLDEANLVRNYVERSYGGLFQSLDYEQYAPPLFSVAVKACIDLFGNNELSVRLFPLLCSMATLALFWRLTQRWLPPTWACLALGFVAFGYVFIDYATECKQYATDGFVALGLLEVAHWAGRRRLTGGIALALAGLGMVAVWLSMPAVFVLAGIGLWWFVRSISTRDTRTIFLVVCMGLSWAASFLLYFFLLLNASAKLSNLQTFHQEYFLAFPPQSKAQWHLLAGQLHLIADRAIGKTVLAISLAAVGFTAGVWQVLKQRDEARWLFLVPIGTCLAASALHYYSLIPRLTLFFLPLVVLIVFMGLAALTTRLIPYLVVLVLAALVLGNQQQLRSLFSPFHSDYAEVRNGLEYIARQRQPGEAVFMNYNVAPIARYYLVDRTPPIRLDSVVLQPSRAASPDEAFYEDVRRLHQQGASRVWLLYDRADESLRDFAVTQGRILNRHNFQRGYVLLLEFK